MTKKIDFDDEEKEILELFEAGKLVRSKNSEVERQEAKKAAAVYFLKDKRVNIRMASHDLDRIKRMAAHEGIPYQTLMASILHKFASGYLSEAKKR